MDIMSGLTAASTAIEIAKAMRSAEKHFDAAVYRGQVADLTIALSDAKLALVEAKETMAAQAEEIARIRESIQEAADLVEGRGGFRWKTNAAGEKVGYPVCPSCLAVENRIVNLVQNGHHRSAKCPVCATEFPQVSYFTARESGEIVEQDVLDDEAARARSLEASRRLSELGRRMNNPYV